MSIIEMMPTDPSAPTTGVLQDGGTAFVASTLRVPKIWRGSYVAGSTIESAPLIPVAVALVPALVREQGLHGSMLSSSRELRKGL